MALRIQSTPDKDDISNAGAALYAGNKLSFLVTGSHKTEMPKSVSGSLKIKWDRCQTARSADTTK